MINLFYDCYQILSKVYSDGAFLKQTILDTAVEPLNKQKTIKICYGVIEKDIYLDYRLSKCYDKPPKQKIRILLKIGGYAIAFLDKKPFAVIDNIVELTKKLGKGGSAGFVNAVLRKFCYVKFDFPQSVAGFLSVKYSCPEFAVKKLLNFYGEEKTENILKFDEEYTFVRFNDGIDGKEYLSERGLKYDATPFYNLFNVPKMKMDEDFEKGIYTFQSVGSVAVCSVFERGRFLLDACAAPGGKSVLLSSKFDEITSCDIYEHRVKLIEKYVDRMHKQNITARCADSSEYVEAFREKFDAVLCDAPCSGYGTIKQNPDIKLRKTDDDIVELNGLQRRILNNVSKYVSPGGVLVYSTCSVFKEENDDVVKNFLAENDCFELTFPDCTLSHVKTEYGLQFTPDISMGAGFYLSKLKRIK